MLKGISRQVVEVTDTGSPYFERAWLIVRADCAETPTRLQEECARVLRHATPHSGMKRAALRRRLSTAVTALLAGGGGALLGWLLGSR